MTIPRQIGITGGIGSGKSLICRIFGCLGVAVYDADSRAKAVMTTDGILISEIKKEFGGLSYNEDGVLNRQYLAQTVFHDPEKLKKLNQLVHPRVREDYTRWLTDHRDDLYVIREAALLVETGQQSQLDAILVVVAPVQVRMARTLGRDPQRTQEQIEAIMSRQMSDEEKIKHADHIIVNDNKTLVVPQVLALHNRLTSGTKI
jgi:dephospho-CoA kinase